VAPDLIATASHCLFRDKPAASPLAQFVFSIDRPDGKISSSIAGAAGGTERQNVMTGAMRLKLRPPIDAASDWAVVRLAQPMCAGHALPVRVLSPAAIESAARAQKVFQVSFHADFGDWELAYSQACDVRQEFEGLSRTLIHKEFTHPEGLLLHRCDTGEASSGSPILMETDSGPVVIGINVGTYVQSRILLRNGKVEKTFKPRTIANTGVNAEHFSREIETFRQSKVLSSSAEIARIQHALRALRLYSGPTNGRYGELTRAAIIAFERSKRLPETGLPTSELAARLLRRPPLPERKPGSRSAALHGTGG
jgi:protease YdgD